MNYETDAYWEVIITDHLTKTSNNDLFRRWTKGKDAVAMLKRVVNHIGYRLVDAGTPLTQTCVMAGELLYREELGVEAELDSILCGKLGSRFINVLFCYDLINFIDIQYQSRAGQAQKFIYCICTEFEKYCQTLVRSKRVIDLSNKPNDWTSPWNNGVPIVKRMGKRKEFYTEEAMPEVYDALNILQNVPWTVNSKLLDVATAGLDGFSPITVDEEELKVAKVDIKTAKRCSLTYEMLNFQKLIERFPTALAKKWSSVSSIDSFKRKSKESRDIISDAAKMVSFVDTVEAAIDLEHETLYFMHNACSRGRLYTIANVLDPQGDDISKALLLFANPSKDVNEYWIKAHIAAQAGVDKLSFDGRVAWFNDNISILRIIGTNPADERSLAWMYDQGIHNEKKTKWQFIAACMEFVKWEETGEWAVPVAKDATCSGLQFLSAISRDNNVAQHVNISKCEYAPVGDVYQVVGNAATKLLDYERAPSMAHLSSGNKTLRKVFKRPTMTFGYSAGPATMGDSIFEDRDTFTDDKLMEMPFKECSYIGNVAYNAIKTELPMAYALMKSMQDGFKGYDGSPEVSFINPVGFRSFQCKAKKKERRIQFTFGHGGVTTGLITRQSFLVETDKPNINDHKKAVAPNVIHSLDSAMLIKITRGLHAAGIQNIAVVHDQFATDSCNVDVMTEIAQQSFYDIVTGDPVKKAMDQMVPGKYVKPETGTWNPDDALKAPYIIS